MEGLRGQCRAYGGLWGQWRVCVVDGVSMGVNGGPIGVFGVNGGSVGVCGVNGGSMGVFGVNGGSIGSMEGL